MDSQTPQETRRPPRRRPVVGIIGNKGVVGSSYPVHSAGTMNSCAVANVARCLPLIVPTDPEIVSLEALLESCDGFLLTGGRPNVHPAEYGEVETIKHGTSTATAMRSPCRSSAPVSSAASPSSASAAAFRR